MGCPYMKEEGVGSYYCSIMGGYVDRDHFSRYCYQSLDYHDCPSWNHQDTRSREQGHSGAARQQGDNGCYLTTACTMAKKLPDDCVELTTLRWFRDNYLLHRDEGTRDIAEYYYIAPKIVNKINCSADAKDVWDNLYISLILPCIKLIREGRFEDAYTLYKETTQMLKDKYLC